MEAIKKIDNGIGWVLRMLSAIMLGVVFLLYLYTTFMRFFIGMMPFLPVITAHSEISEWCLVWAIFLSSAEVARQKGHIVVDFIIVRFQGRLFGDILSVIVHLITLVFCVAMAISGMIYISKSTAMSTYLPFGKRWFYLCIPICFWLMAIYAVRDLITDFVTISKRLKENKAVQN